MQTMHQSLLNRFRGAFLGAVLGEAIGTASLTVSPRSIWQTLQQGKLPLASIQWRWSQYLLQQAELLSRESAIEMQSADNAVELALQTLPIALFYHDHPAILQTVLQEKLQITPEPGLAAAVIGHTVSLVLRERFVPDQLIPQLIQDLNLSPSPLTQQLQQVQTWLEQSLDLATLKHLVQQTPVADANFLAIGLALYSFLSTPYAFELTLLRLAQIAPQPIATCALAGTISGLYNGWSGLALGWRQAIWTTSVGRQTRLDIQLDIQTEAALLQRADRLLAAWSGAEPTQWLQQPHASITAAPRVIPLT